MNEHHPRHRFDPAKARNLLNPARRLIDDPLSLLRQMGVCSGLRVADMGCGPGFFIPALLHLTAPGGRVTALDDEPAMLALLAEEVGDTPALHRVQGDIRATGLPTASLDLLLFAFTLHEVESAPTLEEARRLLVPEGVLLVLEWGAGVCPDRGDGQAAGPPMAHRLLSEPLHGLLQSHGFAPEATGDRLNGCQYWCRAVRSL